MNESMTITSEVERIDEARRWVSERARAAGGADDAIADVELALTEALANVVEHAYEGRAGHEIVVSVEESGDGCLLVRVRDWGLPADPASFESRDLDDPGEGGYGIFLMAELMDRVTREPQPDGGTLLTLTKDLAAHTNEGGPDG